MLLILLGLSSPLFAQRQMENLTRGIVAVRQADGGVFVSWRLFGTDPDNIAFNVYRIANNAVPLKINDRPITNATHWIDGKADTNQTSTYFVRPVVNRKELERARPTQSCNSTPSRSARAVTRTPPSVPTRKGSSPANSRSSSFSTAFFLLRNANPSKGISKKNMACSCAAWRARRSRKAPFRW